MLIPCYVQILTLLKPHIPASFNINLVISKCVRAVEVSNFSGHYLRNRSTLDIVVYFNIRNTLPNFLTFLPGHPVYIYVYIHIYICRCCLHLLLNEKLIFS
jgi:hypothetical protein